MTGGDLLRSAAVGLVILAVPAEGSAKTCTKELSQKELGGSEPFEMTCETVAVKLPPIESEMYYHRWSGQIIVRSIRGDDEARINLAAFDAAGDLVGVMGLVPREIRSKSKSIPFRMEGMYISTVNAARILMSVSLPERKSR